MDEREVSTCPSCTPGRGRRPGRPRTDPVPGGPVVLARPAPGVVGESRRTVHVFPAGPEAGHLTAYCGLRIRPESVEVLDRITGMPCETCLMIAMGRHSRATHPFRRPTR